jgi:phage repressor protein C with HTH and peptisase S24 domain
MTDFLQQPTMKNIADSNTIYEVQGVTYYDVYTDEMLPDINIGDRIVITPKEIDIERKLIDGRTYLIDTKYNGMMLRKLYKEDNGFRAESTNPAYRAEFIEYDEVVRVFRIVGLIRTNI